MTTVQDILTFMEGLAPYELAESWDNVGLLCGDRAQEVTSVLCALDVTETVVQEAAERGAQLVVAHHPGDLYLSQPCDIGRYDRSSAALRDQARYFYYLHAYQRRLCGGRCQ